MPIYTYECAQCGLRFDRRQKFSDKPLKTCPECRGPVRKLIQPAGIVFKGSGWYITDSKHSSSVTMPSTSKDKDNSPSGSTDTQSSSTPKPTADKD